jgi:hypothetical protein
VNSSSARLRFIVLALTAVFAASVPATEKPARPKRFEAPSGFASRQWGELRRTFDQLPQQPLGVGAAYMVAKEKAVTFDCVVTIDGCDFQATLLRLRTEFEGGGFYVLSEYAIPDQGFRMGNEKDGVLLHPVVYQFCANWRGSMRKKKEPPNFDELNQFCGMRLQFQSESREDLAKLPPDQVTVYDRMLNELVARFGKPANYLRRGSVLIETEEGRSAVASERKFRIYRWCPADGDGFHTRCDASVVLSINPATGLGTVLYSTPLLWEYAYARNVNHRGDRLYKLLHAAH